MLVIPDSSIYMNRTNIAIKIVLFECGRPHNPLSTMNLLLRSIQYSKFIILCVMVNIVGIMPNESK